MRAIEFIKKLDGSGLRYLDNGKEFIEFLGFPFPVSEIEGDRSVGYMEGHGYLLVHKERSEKRYPDNDI